MEERKRFPPSGAAVAASDWTVRLTLFPFHSQGYSNSELNPEGTRKSVNRGCGATTVRDKAACTSHTDLLPKNECVVVGELAKATSAR